MNLGLTTWLEVVSLSNRFVREPAGFSCLFRLFG
jgi:hypothetical protein